MPVYIKVVGDHVLLAGTVATEQMINEGYFPYEGELYEFNKWENGRVVPDTDAINAKARQHIPTKVPMASAKVIIARKNLMSAVNAAIDSLEEPQKTEMRIVFENATVVERGSPFMAAMQAALGLTDEQLDQMFIEAAEFDKSISSS
jgi:hypothetical protein